jgi:hypothetical protein
MSIIPSDGQSPFDAIREIDEDGNEYWSARRLQPLMGYARWHDFKRPLERAMSAARNTGADVEEVFRRSPENPSGQVGRPGADFRLIRYAAYLTAMNGDPNKSEVAEAQAYFAAKTREAETSQQRPFLVPTTFADALELAARQARELEAVRAEKAELEATNAKLSPKARVADQYEANPGITPTVFHKTHFPAIGERDFFEHLYRKDYLIDQRHTRWNERKEEWQDGPEHAHPTAKGKRYFYLAPKLDRKGVRRQQTLVIPGDAELDLVAALERDGLPSRNRPALPGADVVRLPRQLGRGDSA